MSVLVAAAFVLLGGYVGWNIGNRQWKTGVHVRDMKMATDPAFVAAVAAAVHAHLKRRLPEATTKRTTGTRG